MSALTVADRAPFDPAARGYHAVYREETVNHCPGCSRTHWLIGRLMAECAFCGTALPLSQPLTRGPSAPETIRHRNSRPSWAC